MSGKRNLSADGCTIKTLLLCIRRAVAGLVRRSQQVNLRQLSRYTVIILAAVAQYSLSPPSPELHLPLSLGDFISFCQHFLPLKQCKQSQVIRTNLHSGFYFSAAATSFRIIISAYVTNKLESHAFTPTQIYSIYDNRARKSLVSSLCKFYTYSKTGKKANKDLQCINVQRLNGWFK